MSSIFRSLTLSATMILALSACASLETRGLPKCSGHDRRPLNSDLWGWEKATPQASDSSVVKNFAPIPQSRPEAIEAVEQLTSNEQPRWNVAASEEPCA